MNTIGIIGGLAWPSTAVYYQKINEGIARRLGGMHCARLILAQTDFDIIERFEREERWEEVAETLIGLGMGLKRSGADFFLIACNTVHTVAERVQVEVDLPFIHIVDPTARQVLAGGYKRVGLLGSRYTMCGEYFVKRLEQRYGLKVLIPEGVDQDNVHNALFEEIAVGVYTDATRGLFRDAMLHLVERGAEANILGCTEFGLLVRQEDSPVPIIDTTLAHVDAAVEAALAG